MNIFSSMRIKKKLVVLFLLMGLVPLIIAGAFSMNRSAAAIMKGQQDKLDAFMSLAHEFGTGIVCLSIDENGVAATTDAKLEIAMRALATAIEVGVPMDDIYLDPIILPVNCDQKAPGMVLETISQFKMLSDPAPHVVIGLSNLSQGATERPLINRTFIVMAIANGLDACIHDPLDKELMDEMVTAEVLLDKTIYSNSYLQAYYQGRT